MKVFREYASMPVSSLAKKLFEVRGDAGKLSKNKGEIFHSVVEKYCSL